MAKFKIVYEPTAKKVIDVIPYDTIVSDDKSAELINNIQTKLDKIRNDKAVITAGMTKAEIIQAASDIFTYIDDQLKLIKADIQNYSSNTYTKQDLLITTPVRAKAVFDAFNIDYSGFVDLE